ncbi:MAG: YdiU family protein [Methylacidiphilales bacterium]|nr:YdiU family protein [Candidatus Methylacidiphilales bacterium]
MTLPETFNHPPSHNPLLSLQYEPALESLGDDYYDEVIAAEYPQHILRWRNDALLPRLGLNPASITDDDFCQAFGKFEGRKPLLALRYHGYQFGEYNSHLGDGRGFLYGQVRGIDGELYDFGTKGSGRTPYSRGGDGMLTLKGGVREVLAAETLHRMGVRTSRCLSLVETGLDLWRGDEPSPTRSSVMIRMSKSHIRFGTFERLNYIQRPDLIKMLLNHVIDTYYPHLSNEQEKYALFYGELVQKVAEVAAQWMASGFCHAVLNTDNMSITGESFDYGPYAFIPNFDSQFTAAYFDYSGRYSYGNQPGICKLNLELLQRPLAAAIRTKDMETGLSSFEDFYDAEYRRLMLRKLGFEQLDNSGDNPELEELLRATLKFLNTYPVSYHHFFSDIAATFSSKWRDDASCILSDSEIGQSLGVSDLFVNWSGIYHRILSNFAPDEIEKIALILNKYNPRTVILRPVIESVWENIAQEDNWLPFNDLLKEIQGV